MAKRPNVIMIMTDQQRADTIGPRRHPCANYPNMEALRGASVAFADFYASALPCVPSRACFLMGKNAWNFNCRCNARFYSDARPFEPLNKTWMQALREAGYACVSVGKTHLVNAGSYPVQVPLENSFGREDGWDHFHPAATPAKAGRYFDERVADAACLALERLQGDPFALFIGFHAPHEPYVMPERYLDFVRPEDVPLPGNRALDEYESKSCAYRARIAHFQRMFGDVLHDDDSVRRASAAYFGMLKMVDDALGRVLDKIRELNLWEDTLIVFTSDHGEMLGSHYLFNKNATCYEEECHIPFLLKLPGGAHAGEQVRGLCAGIDLYPTLMDLLAVDPDVPLPGGSLMPRITGTAPARDHVLCWYGLNNLALRTPTHKLMLHPAEGDGEMYDLAADPGEMMNLFADPAYAALRARLTEKMLLERMRADEKCSALTARERLAHREVYASCEPEVVAGGARL